MASNSKGMTPQSIPSSKNKFEKLSNFGSSLKTHAFLKISAEKDNYPSFMTEEVITMPPLLLTASDSDQCWQEISTNLTQKNPSNFYFKRILPKSTLEIQSNSPVGLSDTISPTLKVNKEVVAKVWESKKKALLEYCRNKTNIREKFRVLCLTMRTIRKVNQKSIRQKILFQKKRSIEIAPSSQEKEQDERIIEEEGPDPFNWKNRRRRSADYDFFNIGTGEKLSNLPQVTNTKYEKGMKTQRNGSFSYSGKNTSLRYLSDRSRQDIEDTRKEKSRRKSSRMSRVINKTHVIVMMSQSKNRNSLSKGLNLASNRSSIAGTPATVKISHQGSPAKTKDGKSSPTMPRSPGLKNPPTVSVRSISGLPMINAFQGLMLKDSSSKLVPTEFKTPFCVSMQELNEPELPPAMNVGSASKNMDFMSQQDISLREEEELDEERKKLKPETSVTGTESIDEAELRELKEVQEYQEWEENKNIYLKHTVPTDKRNAKYLKGSNVSHDFGIISPFRTFSKPNVRNLKSSCSQKSSFVKQFNTTDSNGTARRMISTPDVKFTNLKIRTKRDKKRKFIETPLPEGLEKKSSYFSLYSFKNSLGKILNMKKSSTPYVAPLSCIERSSPKSMNKTQSKEKIRPFLRTRKGGDTQKKSKESFNGKFELLKNPKSKKLVTKSFA